MVFATSKWLLSCRNCGEKYPEKSIENFHGKCGRAGFVDVVLEEMERKVHRNLPSIFKFKDYMPILDEHVPLLQGAETIPDVPIFYSQQLSDELGIHVYFADMIQNPTGSWKDFDGFITMYRVYQNNVPEIAASSSGNAGTAMARAATLFGATIRKTDPSFKGPVLHLFLPESGRTAVGYQKGFFHPDHTRVTFVHGDNDEALQAAQKFSGESGVPLIGGFFNYVKREGTAKFLGLCYRFNFMPKNDPVQWYAQAVSSGNGIYAFQKASLDGEFECPKILGVQADACSPMANAWKEKHLGPLEDRHSPKEIPPTPFLRILKTKKPASYPYLAEIVRETNGAFESVTSIDFGCEIHSALKKLHSEPYYTELREAGGPMPGLESATALAGVIKSVHNGTIRPQERVLVVSSGAAKAGDLRAEWF
ncbi:Threonine synthase [Candidatus Gugararchaeum adminiculabundum]|nr:Threonine synthase [Candidatus Gugararchaeum adminiculabundum]